MKKYVINNKQMKKNCWAMMLFFHCFAHNLMAQYTGSLPVTLTVPTTATSVVWYKDNVVISGATATTYAASTVGEYYATYTDGTTTCTTDRSRTFILANGGSNVTLTGLTNNGTGTNYQWFNATTPIAAATTANYTATVGGKYHLAYDNGSCVVKTPEFYLFLIACSAGTTAPSLSGTNAVNACPTTTTNLNALHNGTIPNGARLRWHTVATNPTAADSTATPSVLATSGTYYAYYFDELNNCYSPASAAVTVTITACGACATPSVGGTATYAGGTICSTANMELVTLSGKTGDVVKWQTSINSGTTWTDIAGTANKNSYTFINAANGQQFRAVVNSGSGCADAFSTPATITTSTTACTTTTCSYSSGTFSPNITTSTNPTFTTHLVLVNPTTGVMQYVTAANSTAFTGVADGNYILHAITFDNTITPVPTITAGTNISTLTGCFSVSPPLLTKVCINSCAGFAAPTASVATQPTCITLTAAVSVTGLPSTGTWTLTRLNTTTLVSVVITSTGSGSTFFYGNVPVGTYTYTVKDNATNCVSSASNSITVSAATPPTLSSVAKTDPSVASCPALNDGTIGVTASGSNLEYSKDNGATWQSNNTFTGLVAGSYTIKVKDNVTNCETTYPSNPVVLTAPVCNIAPTITSAGTATTPENVSTTTPVYTVTSTDPNVGQTPTYSFETGGADNAKFTIDPTTGAIKFIASPDFETPTDANGDNIYEITVKACDNGTPQYCATKMVQITVTDVLECASPSIGGTTAFTGGTLCSTANTGTITLTGKTGNVVKWQTSTNGGTSWTDIANTTTSLTFTNAANGQQYRAVVNNSGGCTNANSSQTIVTTSAAACSTDCIVPKPSITSH